MKEGYLQKKGQRLKGWKRRWFVCDGRSLSYYIHRKDRKPNAVIPLEGCTVQDGGISETWNSPRIYLTDATSGVMYCLSAEEGEVVSQWLVVLRNAVAKLGTSSASSGATRPSSMQRPVRVARVENEERSGHAAAVSGTTLREAASATASSMQETRTTASRAFMSSPSVLDKPRTIRMTSGPMPAPLHGASKTHRGKIQHLPTTISLENDLSHGMDVLESLLSSRSSSSSSRQSVLFRPISSVDGVLKSVGTDTASGRSFARASVVLPVSSEFAADLLTDHAKRADWDLHFPHSVHIASFDDATDLVHLSGGFRQLQSTKPFAPSHVAAAACSLGAGLLSGSWETMVANMLYAGVAGGMVNSVDLGTLCAPRDLLVLRHVRESSILDKRHGSSTNLLVNAEGEECGQSLVMILEKSVVNELKPTTSGVVRAHIGLSGWLLEPVDATRTLATYVTDLDMKGWVSAATRQQFLLERLDCVAVLREYVTQSHLCGALQAMDFDAQDSGDEHDLTSSQSDDDDYTSEPVEAGAVEGVLQGTIPHFHPKSYMRGMMRLQTGGLKLTDKEIAKKQGGVLKEVIKSAGAKILEGKGTVSLSLPVRIFEPRTNLERAVDLFLYGPTLLNMAADQSDPLERFKFVMAFAVAGLHLSVGQLKPFNPILGETFQAKLSDDTEVFCEHTSHHPPISNFQLVGKKYSIAGFVLWHGSFSMKSNAVFQTNKGPIRVSFADGTTVSYNLPFLQYGGFLWGDRTVEVLGSMVFEDPKNQLQCELKFNPDEKKGMGGMFSSSKTPTDCVRGVIVNTRNGSEVCEATGSWLDGLRFADKPYWTMNRDRSGHLVALPESAVLLESDSRNREDLKWLAAGDLDEAQDWKVKLEVLQRADRKIRNDGRRPNHWAMKEGASSH